MEPHRVSPIIRQGLY